MNRFFAGITLIALLPLVGCATPYGYSPGAWANYDDDYDYGYDGYDRPISYYGEMRYGQPYGNGYYAGQPSFGGYYSQPYYGGYYSQGYYGPAPAYGPSWYSTYYSGCGCY